MSANTEMYTHFVPEFSVFQDSFVQNGNESKFKIKNYKKKDTENEEIVHEFNIVSYKKEYLDALPEVYKAAIETVKTEYFAINGLHVYFIDLFYFYNDDDGHGRNIANKITKVR